MNVAEQDPAFTALLRYLQEDRGCDFSAYKQSSVLRRVRKRMHALNHDSLADYADYLAATPDEFIRLFNTILINVTTFFRDQPAWTYLQKAVIPRLLTDKPEAQPVRVWSAGCASGEEAYSVAIALAEILGRDAFRERVRIFATDLDEEALAQGRRALYRAQDLQHIPVDLRARYFEPFGNVFLLRDIIRQAVVFGRHDITRDAPIANLDLLVCRNTLMYFTTETQQRILSRFNYALRERGVLFLGKAEMLLTHAQLFAPLELAHRVFIKVPPAPYPLAGPRNGPVVVEHRTRSGLLSLASEASPLAQIVVDPAGALVAANAQARHLFAITSADLDLPLQQHPLYYRPVDLRVHLDRCQRERRVVTIKDAPAPSEGGTRFWEVHLLPLLDEAGVCLGVGVTFADLSCYHQWRLNAEESLRKLKVADEELIIAREELATANGELMTVNAELTTINAELETLNQGLQAAHQELDTVTEDARQRDAALARANAFLGGLLNGWPGAVIEVDRQQRFRLWNGQAGELLKVAIDDADWRPLALLDQAWVDCLQPCLRRALEGYPQTRIVTLDVAAGGRPLRISVQPPQGDVGAIVLLHEVEHAL